ncbi:MAG: hypothetical protein ACT6UH_07205 [Hydrogenophaga sp.]|uniref:hypothetical protein n=1 Tax=Hydrogenophaga sp. TaxID=1904254 RepID=UPI004035EBC4
MSEHVIQKKSALLLVSAFASTIAVLMLGYVLLGWVAAFLFSFGFLGGLVVWLLVPTNASYRDIRAPFLLTLLLFIGHKLEERHLEFFPALSQITGIPAPPSGTLLGTLLYIFAGAWLLVPWLVERRLPFGYYLASTFFFAMGITELAHFVFPFFTGENYGYFPGMASVFFLAPAAWWGLWKMYR